MTIAVCFRCGAIKPGPLGRCDKCSALPHAEAEVADSLALTEHYFDVSTLERMGESIRQGQAVQLSPRTRSQLIKQIRELGICENLQRQYVQLGMLSPTGEVAGVAESSRPWWRFW